ncbi:MAG: MgtC/SapB family protein [Candidatus Peregrinibacteria bacterium]
MDFEIMKQLGIALVLSSLIGLEREQKYQRYGYEAFGGIRTMPLVGMLGALAYMLSKYSVWIFVVMTVGFLALLVVSYYMGVRSSKTPGATTEVATMMVYIVGILSATGQILLATSVALAVLLILHSKDTLHRWAGHLKNRELVSTIQFAIIAFVVLPMLPNEYYGPYGFFNPYVVWLMVVFISGISFLSYIAIKLFGARKGIGLTGFLAGLISSTALALSFSSQSKKNKNVVNPYVVAVVVASSAMFFRILLEVAVLNIAILKYVLVPMVSMGVVGIICAVIFWVKKEKPSGKVSGKLKELKSPFSLWPAVKFGIFFAVILFFVNFGKAMMGNSGIYITSIVSGFADVDAITVSMANISKNGLPASVAVNAITLAAMTNTLIKGFLFVIFGSRKVSLRIAGVFLLMLAAGGISLVFV